MSMSKSERIARARLAVASRLAETHADPNERQRYQQLIGEHRRAFRLAKAARLRSQAEALEAKAVAS